MGKRFKFVVGLGAVMALSLGAVAVAQERGPKRLREGGERVKACRRVHAPMKMRNLVHSESIFKTDEGLATLAIDAGEITNLSDSSKTITLKREDEKTVTVKAGDDSRICRDGENSTFEDLEVGDTAVVRQIDRDDVQRVMIKAHSGDAE